jgi:gas vesicle structural protein
MAVERVSGGSSLIDVLDRVLDKGIVVDAWVRISMVGIDLLTAGARVEVASIETCLQYADGANHPGPVSRAALSEAGENGVRELGEVRPHASRRRR